MGRAIFTADNIAIGIWMDKGSKAALLVAAGAFGFIWLYRKLCGIKELAQSVSLTPMFEGVPRVSGGDLVFPVQVLIKNPSGGSLTVGVSRLEAYMGGKLTARTIAPSKSEVTIAAGGNSVLSGYRVCVPINTLVQVIGGNAYNIVNGDMSKILSRLTIRLDAVIGGSITVSVTHSMGGGVGALGGVAAERRIGPLSDYAAYIPPRSGLRRDDLYVSTSASTEDTVRLMLDVVRKTTSDTARLAAHLRRATVAETLQSVWDFVAGYIKYELDSAFAEQVRRPLRTLYDQRGDCDCYSVLIASLLTNMGIGWRFRIAKYYGRSYWQHVYVIVPKAGGGYWVCDPVMDRCFKEKEASEVKDFGA